MWIRKDRRRRGDARIVRLVPDDGKAVAVEVGGFAHTVRKATVHLQNPALTIERLRKVAALVVHEQLHVPFVLTEGEYVLMRDVVRIDVFLDVMVRRVHV